MNPYYSPYHKFDFPGIVLCLGLALLAFGVCTGSVQAQDMRTNGYVAGGFLSQTPGTIHSLDDVTLSFFIQHDAYSGNYSYQFSTGLQEA